MPRCLVPFRHHLAANRIQNHPNESQAVPLEANLIRFWNTIGNVKMICSFTPNHIFESWWGSWEQFLKHFAHNVFHRAARNDCFPIFYDSVDFGEFWPPSPKWNGQVCPFWPLDPGWSEAPLPGPPRSPGAPTWLQNRSQISPRLPKPLSKERELSTISLGMNRSIGLSTRARWRVCRRQLAIYTGCGFVRHLFT